MTHGVYMVLDYLYGQLELAWPTVRPDSALRYRWLVWLDAGDYDTERGDRQLSPCPYVDPEMREVQA